MIWSVGRRHGSCMACMHHPVTRHFVRAHSAHLCARLGSMTKHKHPRGYLQELIRTGHPDKPDKCWLWPGAKRSDGYSLIKFGGRLQYAHRVAYELHVGPIPDGLMLDHTCHKPACFNPRHLEPVTRVENGQNRAGLEARNMSGHRNVSWYKHGSCWVVKVNRDGIQHHGGYFLSIDDAAAAAERLREELGFRDTTHRHQRDL